MTAPAPGLRHSNEWILDNYAAYCWKFATNSKRSAAALLLDETAKATLRAEVLAADLHSSLAAANEQSSKCLEQFERGVHADWTPLNGMVGNAGMLCDRAAQYRATAEAARSLQKRVEEMGLLNKPLVERWEAARERGDTV